MNKIKRMAIAGAAAGMFLSSAAGVFAVGRVAPPIDTSAIPDGQTAICHIPGASHDADFLISGVGKGCIKDGGMILILPDSALGGHGLESHGGGIQPPIDINTVPDGKTAICHIPGSGHEEDWAISGQGYQCVESGGLILIVSNSALGGHDIDTE